MYSAVEHLQPSLVGAAMAAPSTQPARHPQGAYTSVPIRFVATLAPWRHCLIVMFLQRAPEGCTASVHYAGVNGPKRTHNRTSEFYIFVHPEQLPHTHGQHSRASPTRARMHSRPSPRPLDMYSIISRYIVQYYVARSRSTAGRGRCIYARHIIN